MISIYKDSKHEIKKSYKAFKIRRGKDKNNNPYTTFSISDSQCTNGKWKSDFYTVYVQKCLNIDEKDDIVFAELYGFECSERMYGGKTYLFRTIFADVDVISKSQPTEAPSFDWDYDTAF